MPDKTKEKLKKPRDEDVSPKLDIMQIGRMVACVHNGDNDMGPLITMTMTMQTMTMMIMGC